jgi:hypothetical protein
VRPRRSSGAFIGVVSAAEMAVLLERDESEDLYFESAKIQRPVDGRLALLDVLPKLELLLESFGIGDLGVFWNP